MAQNFENAFLRTQPSVSAADREFYIRMKDRLFKARAVSTVARAAEEAREGVEEGTSHGGKRRGRRRDGDGGECNGGEGNGGEGNDGRECS